MRTIEEINNRINEIEKLIKEYRKKQDREGLTEGEQNFFTGIHWELSTLYWVKGGK